jgi:hypothetical protein
MKSIGTIIHIPHIELDLVKALAYWMSKLLFQGQNKEKVRWAKAFIKLIQQQQKTVQGNIIIMDELGVSLHTPEKKKPVKEVAYEGATGPVKAQVHARQSKQMVLAFFDKKVTVYSFYATKGKEVNTDYVIKAPCTFLKVLKEKTPELRAGEWFFQWDNAPLHSGMAGKEFWAQKFI